MKDNLSKCPETDFPILDRSILFSSKSQYDEILKRVLANLKILHSTTSGQGEVWMLTFQVKSARQLFESEIFEVLNLQNMVEMFNLNV